jgi:hypothetical protein
MQIFGKGVVELTSDESRSKGDVRRLQHCRILLYQRLSWHSPRRRDRGGPNNSQILQFLQPISNF